MSKPKRPSIKSQLDQEDSATLSRDDVVTLDVLAEGPPVDRKKPQAPRSPKIVEDALPSPQRRSANDRQRHSYHTSLYLPDEAQFALREIALTMRRAKPHDVMLEAMAELFEKYNKGDLARECRRRITSRDKVTT